MSYIPKSINGGSEQILNLAVSKLKIPTLRNAREMQFYFYKTRKSYFYIHNTQAFLVCT